MIIPLQSALTSVLPSTVETLRSHDPFPEKAVEIQSKLQLRGTLLTRRHR